MATVIPSDTNWNTLSGGSSSLGNPADLGPWRGMVQQRGATYDNRATDTYNWGLGRSDEIGVTGKAVTNQALDTSKAFNNYATQDRSTWDQNYLPAMLDQLNYARNYTTDARKQANRGGAMADVAMTFDAASDLAKRNLQSYGINPNSGQFAGLETGTATARAKALAGAGTKSDRDTEMMGQQLLDNAIGRGSILPGQAVNEAGVGIAAGNQAVNTDLATAQTQQALRQPSGWVGSGDQLLQSWKDSLLQQTGLGLQQNRDVAQNNLAQQQIANASSSGAGAGIGAGLGMLGSLFGKGGAGTSMLSSLGMIAAASKGGMIKRYADGGMVDEGQDEGESIGSDVGSTAGSLIGSIWGPIGSVAGNEIGKSVGSAVGAAAQGHWGEAAGNLLRGAIPKFADGGMADDQLYGDEDEIAPDDEGAEGETPGVSGNPNVVPQNASPSGGAETDDVTARVNVGEFVMPKDVTSWYGEKFMQNLIEKARKEMTQRTAEPDVAPAPQAMAINPPSYASPGAMAG